MKSKTSFCIILFVLALVACVPVSTTAPKNTLTFTVTSTLIQATLTPQSTTTSIQSNIPMSTSFVNEKASEDCFLDIDFNLEKTKMEEVIFAWGAPFSKTSLGTDYQYWHFDFIGTPQINFEKQVISKVNFSLKNCSLEKIFTELGSPEKVEITVLFSCIGGPPIYMQYFHYQSLGYSFYRSCDETQNCFTFHATDSVFGKEFYSSKKIIEDSTGFNMASYIYNWHSFGVDVEKMENKIKGFVTLAP